MVLFQKSDNRAQHICTTCFPKFAKKAENVLKRCVHVEMQNLLKFTIQDGYAEIQAENKNWIVASIADLCTPIPKQKK